MNTPYNQDYKRNCSGNEKLTKENTQFEAQLQFVSDAVMAFAHAFRYNYFVKIFEVGLQNSNYKIHNKRNLYCFIVNIMG